MNSSGARRTLIPCVTVASLIVGCGSAVAPEGRPVRLLHVSGVEVCVVDDDDGVWCWGGHMDLLASNVRSIEGSGETKCLIDQQGRPFCWGYASSWIFDPNTHSAVTEPRLVAFDRPVRSVSAGGGVILVLAEDGSVFCRGNNFAGQYELRASRAAADRTRIEGLNHAPIERRRNEPSIGVVEIKSNRRESREKSTTIE